MFTRTFLVGKTHVMGRAVSLVLALGFVMGALSLAGCPMGNEVGNLVGDWQLISDPGGEYEYITNIHITNDTVVYEKTYEGTIRNGPNFEAENGILIIEFSKYADWDGAQMNWNSASENIGKFGALYWKGLTADTVSLADAYENGAVHKIVGDLETAKTTFTDDAVLDYIDWSITSPYNRK
jgi:hypothetical protein